ncbi:hypothetical protein DSM104299_00977 [Baekduia alba]|uniref:hypothetical protein n=1 Tax=Baekduia alba TaxID=2997333 RepID=UPI002340D1AF|nr:hypothetical protein [Baekduia alba]WCB92287.1 hypothetical protein DSM104299_00977 [Baekduia alba]
MSTTELASPPRPTEETPEHGVISIGDVTLSQVVHWMEHDLFVFRSTEFDVIAADEDLQTAIRAFVESAQDYARMVGDLGADELTQDEAETALLIYRRLNDAYQGIAADLRARLAHRVRIVSILRKRGHDAPRSWYRKSSLPTSSPQPHG